MRVLLLLAVLSIAGCVTTGSSQGTVERDDKGNISSWDVTGTGETDADKLIKTPEAN